jgi:hypothetical protein
MPEQTGAAGRPVGDDKPKRAAALAAVQARLDEVVKGQNYASAARPEALGELDRLLELAEPETDPEAAQVAGLMYFCRFLALPDPDERALITVDGSGAA